MHSITLSNAWDYPAFRLYRLMCLSDYGANGLAYGSDIASQSDAY